MAFVESMQQNDERIKQKHADGKPQMFTLGKTSTIRARKVQAK
jgi:hypothetical protein